MRLKVLCFLFGLHSQEEKPDSGGTNFVFGQNMEERVTVSCSNKRKLNAIWTM